MQTIADLEVKLAQQPKELQSLQNQRAELVLDVKKLRNDLADKDIEMRDTIKLHLDAKSELDGKHSLEITENEKKLAQKASEIENLQKGFEVEIMALKKESAEVKAGVERQKDKVR